MLRLCILLLFLLKTTCGYEVEQITEPLLLGEGPHWDANKQLLYFVDITNCTIHVYDPITGEHNYTHVDGGPVTFIIPIEGTENEFLVSTGLDIRHIVWNGEHGTTPVCSIRYTAMQDENGSRFNDAKVDRCGNLWAGTMGPEVTTDVILERDGKLYEVTKYASISAQLENILISNGLAWSADGSVMYYTDTGDNTIDSFDYNSTADNPLSNRQTLFNFTEQGIQGTSDGFTIDTDGNLWLACYGGYQVIKVNPNNGSLLMSIPIDSSQVTSVAWGGADLDELYITTARKGATEEELNNHPNSGATFRVTGLGARGYAGNNYVMYRATSGSSSANFMQILIFIWSLIIFVFKL